MAVNETQKKIKPKLENIRKLRAARILSDPANESWLIEMIDEKINLNEEIIKDILTSQNGN